jgi:hypothetical protein
VEFPNATQVSHDCENELKLDRKEKRSGNENNTDLLLVLDFISVKVFVQLDLDQNMS